MNYQRIVASTGALVGEPAPLPAALVGSVPDDMLADLPAHFDPQALIELGLEDTGFVFVPDPPAPPSVPDKVSRMQLRRQMLRLARTDGVADGTTLVDQVDAQAEVQKTSGTLEGRDFWEYWTQTSEFHRAHATLIAAAAGLGLTGEDLDAAFIAAALLS